jgi:hypothetical protein
VCDRGGNSVISAPSSHANACIRSLTVTVPAGDVTPDLAACQRRGKGIKFDVTSVTSDTAALAMFPAFEEF